VTNYAPADRLSADTSVARETLDVLLASSKIGPTTKEMIDFAGHFTAVNLRLTG